MATNSMIPYSNPAGNNQTNPGAGLYQGSGSGGVTPNTATVPTGNPLQTATNNNPYVPGVLTSTATSTPSAPQPTLTGGYSTNVAPIVPGGTVSNNLQKQLVDIYGQGVGASLFNLLNNMSGTDSTAMQQFIQSLQPQEATAQANLNASLGAAGVGANSSVAAIADANLQAQEFGMISGEQAKMDLDQQQMEASILSGMTGDATKEVASSGWTTFGNVMAGITEDIGALTGGTPFTFGKGPGGIGSGTFSSLMSEGTVAPQSLDMSTAVPTAIEF